VKTGSAAVDPAWPVLGMAPMEGAAVAPEVQAPDTINTASGRVTLIDKWSIRTLSLFFPDWNPGGSAVERCLYTNWVSRKRG
jgi:hypothetical protein